MSNLSEVNNSEKQVISLSSSSSNNSSPTSSISLIKLDELSSFGATKQSRLPALIKLNDLEVDSMQSTRPINSMPTFSANQIEQQSQEMDKTQTSLPAQVRMETSEKENVSMEGDEQVSKLTSAEVEADVGEEFQVVDMVSSDLMGPSLPQPQAVVQGDGDKGIKYNSPMQNLNESQKSVLFSNQQLNSQHPSHLGDSLIDMIINLKTENQNLVRALETNNEYVKDRINEFKLANEEAKKREAQFAMEKAEHEHQVRKLQRQNMVLSERLKSMEAKLKEMKLEVSESLVAAHSSKASSIQNNEQLYPALGEPGSAEFVNSALNQATTIQMDATSGELYNDNDAPQMEFSETNIDESRQTEAKKVANLSKEELSKRFDTNKAEFYAMDDPMKQCDQLEKQLNDIGRRDYEICLLQQQLNIYRQDFRLERMANLEAKIQIEKLKNDIDRLCLERIQEKTNEENDAKLGKHHLHRNSHHRSSGGVRFDPASVAADTVLGLGSKIGHKLSKRASAKVAKHAAKQAYREEKAAAIAAATAAATAARSQEAPTGEQSAYSHHHGHHRRHSHGRSHGVRSEVVSDLLSTANKAMLTGYKLASTHVNLALDKLSAFEQAQANNLARQDGRSTDANKPSAPLAGPPSID